MMSRASQESSLFLPISDEAAWAVTFSRSLLAYGLQHLYLDRATAMRKADQSLILSDQANNPCVYIVEVIIPTTLREALVTSKNAGSPAPLSFDANEQRYTVSPAADATFQNEARFMFELVRIES